MWCASSLVVSRFVTPWTVAPQDPLSVVVLQARMLNWVARPSSRGSSQARDRTQVSHTAADSLQSEHQGSIRILEWIAYPLSRESSPPWNQIGISCIAGGFFTIWAPREAPSLSLIAIHYKTHSLKNCLFCDLEATQKFRRWAEMPMDKYLRAVALSLSFQIYLKFCLQYINYPSLISFIILAFNLLLSDFLFLDLIQSNFACLCRELNPQWKCSAFCWVSPLCISCLCIIYFFVF